MWYTQNTQGNRYARDNGGASAGTGTAGGASAGTSTPGGSGDYFYRLIKSPAPFYAVAALWLLWALALPMYSWYHYVILIVLSAAVSCIFSRLFPPRQIRVERPYKAPVSGDGDTNRTIAGAAETLKSIAASSAEIAPVNPNLAGNAEKLIRETRNILDYLSKNTGKTQLLRRFFSYYLPTLDKLLKTYVVFMTNGGGTQNSVRSQAEIEQAVAAMESVFSKQLDKLLDDVSLDITTDIDVLESMLGKTEIK